MLVHSYTSESPRSPTDQQTWFSHEPTFSKAQCFQFPTECDWLWAGTPAFVYYPIGLRSNGNWKCHESSIVSVSPCEKLLYGFGREDVTGPMIYKAGHFRVWLWRRRGTTGELLDPPLIYLLLSTECQIENKAKIFFLTCQLVHFSITRQARGNR